MVLSVLCYNLAAKIWNGQVNDAQEYQSIIYIIIINI